MRVLHVLPALAERYGGPSLAATGMARALRSAGVEVVLAATNADGPNDLPVELEKETSYRGVPAIFFQRQFSEAFKYSSSFASWLRAHVGAFDVVHIHGVFSHACLAAASACRARGVPYIVRPLGNLTPTCFSRKSLRKRLAWHAGVCEMMAHAAAVHYTCAKEKEDVEASLGLLRGVVVSHGVPLLDGGTPQANPPYVAVLSRIDPVKRLELLVDAFVRVTAVDALKHWRLVIAGDGDELYVRRLIDMIFTSRVADRVLFTGWMEGSEKERLLREASLFALTSAHENFGMSVAEAMSASVPVLVSEEVGLSLDIRRADAGWVAALDPHDIQQKLRDALLHESVRRHRGRNARALIERKFTWPRVAEELVTLYDGLAAAGRSAGRSAHTPSLAA